MEARAVGGFVRVGHEALAAFVARVFGALGVPEGDARDAAEVLTLADLRGVESHGTQNYVRAIYVPGLQQGFINPRPEIRIERRAAAALAVDGDRGLGLVVGRQAMEAVIDLARETGVACATVDNSRHFGMAGFFAMMALEHDMMGVALTNAAPLVVPTYGREPMLGTNPIAFAAPAGEERPFVLDMATSTVAIGKIINRVRLGQPIPPGWAADEAGRPTTDGMAAIQSLRLLPLGGSAETSGYKGYGLAAMVDILSGVLGGMGPGFGMEHTAAGHFFMAVRPDLFRPLDEYRADMDRLIRGLRESPRAEGQGRIYVAGEIEFETEEERRAHGIPIHAEVLRYFRELSAEVGVAYGLPEPPEA